MLKVIGKQLGKGIVLGVSPKVRVKPGQLVSRRAPQCMTYNGFGGIKYYELAEKFFSFAASVIGGQ